MYSRYLSGMLLLLCSTVSAIQADSITITPSQDNTLYFSDTGLLSNGAGSFFFAGRTNAGQLRRGLIAFDIAASVPAGATIQSVSLRLNMSRTIGSDVPVTLRRLQASWGEGTSNANANEGTGAAASAGDATWVHRFFNTTDWASTGGDFSAVVSATSQVNGVGDYFWSSSIMASDAQSWLDNPAVNFGWIVQGDEINNGSSKRFNSREIGDSTLPELTIVFTAVPEPGAWLMIALVLGGSWWFLRNRLHRTRALREAIVECVE